MKTALLFDDDLGFLFWLADILRTAGYQTYPARSLAEAASIMDRIQGGFDLAIVDTRLADAVALVQSLHHSARPPVILALEGDPIRSHVALTDVTFCLSRPNNSSEDELAAWHEALKRCLSGGNAGNAAATN